MEEAGWLKGSSATAPLLVANFPGADPCVAVGLAARLRKSGIGAEVFPDAVQIGKQMGYGSTRGYWFAVIVGPDELKNQVFNLRNLITRQEQKAIPWDDLETTVKAALDSESGIGNGRSGALEPPRDDRAADRRHPGDGRPAP